MENSNQNPKPSKGLKFSLNIYSALRAKGFTQKECSIFAGITEKTAGKYEKERVKKIRSEIKELESLIERLNIRADDPTIKTKELLELTARIEELNTKRRNLEADI